MAVPCSCCQYVSPKVEILLDIIMSRVARKNMVGKSLGIIALFDSMSSVMAWIPIMLSIFVYIAVASAVKIFAFSGRFSCPGCSSRDVESLM